MSTLKRRSSVIAAAAAASLAVIRVGDKTRTGERGAANDVAILRPPGRPPILAAVYLHGATKPIHDLDTAIASAARAAIGRLAST